jgi:hypothetical protein
MCFKQTCSVPLPTPNPVAADGRVQGHSIVIYGGGMLYKQQTLHGVVAVSNTSYTWKNQQHAPNLYLLLVQDSVSDGVLCLGGSQGTLTCSPCKAPSVCTKAGIGSSNLAQKASSVMLVGARCHHLNNMLAMPGTMCAPCKDSKPTASLKRHHQSCWWGAGVTTSTTCSGFRGRWARSRLRMPSGSSY